MSAIDMTALQTWIGKREARTDTITAMPVAGLSAALDYTAPLASMGEPLPPLWHWLFFLATVPASRMDIDGHPVRGDFLPPVPLPRRMWAGSDIRFLAPVCVGDELERVSTIEDVRHKQGRTGDLVFVTLLHRLSHSGQLALEERQSLVYRGADSGGQVARTVGSPPEQPQWSRSIRADSVLLFRYSALTFNSHRIHYDREYATREEGYPGLVVQGPLTAILLMDLLQREMPAVQLQTFSFRGVRPLHDDDTFRLEGRCDGQNVDLWALDSRGATAMTARATLLT